MFFVLVFRALFLTFLCLIS